VVLKPEEKRLEGQAAIDFLNSRGIGYEKWDV
jgi:hypothetical protein